MLVIFSVSTTIDAKSSSFGGARSFSSSRSSFSKPSFSSSKPSASRPTALFKSADVAKPARVVIDRSNVMSAIGKKGATGDAAGALFKNFQARSAPPIKLGQKPSPADIDRVFAPNYRADRRKEYYGSYQAPTSTHYREIVYQNHSNGYGIWDAMLFASILDNVGDRQMYYHHQSDPAFQDWRRDANAACAAGDDDVCDKLKDLDREMSEYKNKGVAQNVSYVTPGVDADIYESINVDPKTLPTIKICTGSVGSDYGKFVNTIEKVTKIKTTSVTTNGSADNLAKLATGMCDLCFVQDDLITSSNLSKILTLDQPTQVEVGLLICSNDSGVNEAEDLTDKHTIYVGSDQTGSQFTLDKLRANSELLSKPSVNSDTTSLALVSVVQANKACAFGVSLPESELFKSLDGSNRAHTVPLYKKHFKNPALYDLVTVKASHYKNLVQEKYKKYGWSEGGTDAISVSTSLVTPNTWTTQNSTLYNLLLLEQNNLKASLQQ